MLPEQIFQTDATLPAPDILVQVLRHVDLGDRVVKAVCRVSVGGSHGHNSKRITQDCYGQPVTEIPVWSIGDRIVADWFALLLESKYQAQVAGKTILIKQELI